MFDWYEPVPDIKCPKCQKILTDWQGKDGPCKLIKFKQHEPAQEVDVLTDEYGKPEHPKTTPENFEIYTYCENMHWTDAEGKAVDGVWLETKITNTRDLNKIP